LKRFDGVQSRAVTADEVECWLKQVCRCLDCWAKVDTKQCEEYPASLCARFVYTFTVPGTELTSTEASVSWMHLLFRFHKILEAVNICFQCLIMASQPAKKNGPGFMKVWERV